MFVTMSTRLLSRGILGSTWFVRSVSTLDAVSKAYPKVDRALLADRILDGEAAANSVLDTVKRQVVELKTKHGVTPGLAVVLVSDRWRKSTQFGYPRRFHTIPSAPRLKPAEIRILPVFRLERNRTL